MRYSRILPRSRSVGKSVLRSAVQCLFVLAAVGARPVWADLFTGYKQAVGFDLPAGTAWFEPLPDGRILLIRNDEIWIESGVRSRSFSPLGTLPGADFPSFGAAFLRVSPGGEKLAVGNNGGSSFADYKVGIFDIATLTGNWFTADHYDAAWIDDIWLALSHGDFVNPSIVSALDTNSPNPATPDIATLVVNIGGASAGVAFHSSGWLLTGNGFQSSGPSQTGDVRAFAPAAWQAALLGGSPLDFEASGLPVTELLSASPLDFDAEGNLLIGGGDFSSVDDFDFVGVVHASAVGAALLGGPVVDPNDSAAVRRLDPDAVNSFNFYAIARNNVTRELYVLDMSSDRVHVYVDGESIPAVSSWGLMNFSLLLLVATTLRLRTTHAPQTRVAIAL